MRGSGVVEQPDNHAVAHRTMSFKACLPSPLSANAFFSHASPKYRSLATDHGWPKALTGLRTSLRRHKVASQRKNLLRREARLAVFLAVAPEVRQSAFPTLLRIQVQACRLSILTFDDDYKIRHRRCRENDVPARSMFAEPRVQGRHLALTQDMRAACTPDFARHNWRLIAVDHQRAATRQTQCHQAANEATVNSTFRHFHLRAATSLPESHRSRATETGGGFNRSLTTARSHSAYPAPPCPLPSPSARLPAPP